MRYLILLHGNVEDVHTASPAEIERLVSFFVRFEDELLESSELDWVEVLGSEAHAAVVAADGSMRDGWIADPAPPLSRVWAVRVRDAERARELAAEIAAAAGQPVEVRDLLPSAHRP